MAAQTTELIEMSSLKRADYIAAIDFGTSNCSLAYSVDGKTINTLCLSESFDRVPTAILIGPEEENTLDSYYSVPMAITDIGYVAQQAYDNLREEDYLTQLYFECFKMKLRPREDVITRQMKISAFHKGASYYLIEVIAFVLTHLKSKLEEELEMRNHMVQQESENAEPRLLKAFDFTWVITVPAIWNEKGKQMMREAAYRAGLLTEDEVKSPITCFTPVTQQLEKVDMNEYYHKLVLGLEPECAALYCQQLSKEEMANHCRVQKSLDCSISNSYMVVDIGGGTVDVAVYSQIGDIFESVLPPIGNDWGGTKVNEEYSKLLQKIFGDPEFKRFCEMPQQEAQNQAVITIQIYHMFESAKVSFGNNTKKERKMSLRLHRKIVKFYGPEKITEGVAALNDPRIQLNGSDLLVIQFSKVEELFAPAVRGIFDCINTAIAKSPIAINTVYLVGGFGGCPYVYNKIKELDKFSNLCVITPRDYRVAVVKGAILFQQNPQTMNSRVSSAYYGLEATIKYDPQKHDRRRKRYDLKRECTVTDNAFEVIVQKYQKIRYDKVLEFPSYATPLSEKSDKVELLLYKTYKDDVAYTRNPNGELCEGVEKVGKLELAIPPSTLPLESRTITLLIRIGGPEFYFQGKNDETEEIVHCMIDFLS